MNRELYETLPTGTDENATGPNSRYVKMVTELGSRSKPSSVYGGDKISMMLFDVLLVLGQTFLE
jgi:hypothetical protein